MHDTELENRLRTALREEGDRLPFHVDVERLEAEVAVRRRARRAGRFGLLAAGIGIVAFGVATIGLNLLLPSNEVAGTPRPTPTVRPTTNPSSPPNVRGLVALEPQEGATILSLIPPAESGTGVTRIVQRPESMTEATSISVDCLGDDPGPEGTETDVVTVSSGQDRYDAICLPDNEFTVTLPLTDRPTTTSISVPAGVAYTILAEAVPVPTELVELGPGMLNADEVEVEDSSDRTAPDWSLTPAIETRHIGTLGEAFSQHTAIVCLGPGVMTVGLREPGAAPNAVPHASTAMACLGEPHLQQVSIGLEGELEVFVEVDTRTAWHVQSSGVGTLPEFTPPTLVMTSRLGDTEIGGNPTPGYVGCGYTWDLDGTGSTGDQCGPPEWPDMTDHSFVIARPNGELRLRLDPGWTLVDPTVRAAPFLQTGKLDAPVNVWGLEATTDGNELVVPIDLSNSRWVVRVDTRGTSGPDSFGASYFFVVDVSP